ncbi:MAG: thioesterase family protein [Acidimicrobiaceae bacterium]|nr:thioesterase family protein [Acidimicrobiaceae bacterium]MCY4174902.1 thioesterase family protein [Acidimicrobiaceae bacterium]MCY4279557.1 thioesterase family protein [Acidimicrobiaceae bacterium]MCY4295289.1 thioesterase family protein [Acidimicrobiaceae bacterium]
MSRFDAETAVTGCGDGLWQCRLSSAWDIGGNSNGGYALSPVLRAMRTLVPHCDPITTTAHFLRPATGDTDSEVRASVIRQGRTVSALRGSLWQQGKQRLEVLAAFSDLPGSGAAGAAAGPEIVEPAPVIPPSGECVKRGFLEQGVEMTLLSRVDVHVHPDHASPGSSDRALIDGWIRFSDGAAPSVMSLPFFGDAMPPSLYPLLGLTGWVPTIELTVQVRRTPAPGWLQVRQETHDLDNGRMIESGTIWDSSGVVVATTRQIGLLLA